MKKTLIASIYTDVSKQNGWYDIQKKFFDLTTTDYDFGIFYNQTEPDLDALTIGQGNISLMMRCCLMDMTNIFTICGLHILR